jgi:H+/Cl- antiporter ClcA
MHDDDLREWRHVPRDLADGLGRELSDWRRWTARIVVLGFAVLTGLAIAAFTWLGEQALALFLAMQGWHAWWPLIWTPALTALIVWVTRRWFIGTASSGIPQVLAALDVRADPAQRRLFVSLRLSLAKLVLTTGSLLAGLSTGREGPSVQVAAGIMHHARRWLPKGAPVNEHGLMVAGGAAGVAAAFNTPLGGIIFAIEELSRRPEERSSGVLIAAIALAGLMAVSIHGKGSYFGRIEAEALQWSMLLPAISVAVASGMLGGLFSRLLIESLRGGGDTLSRFRARHPVMFAAGCGFVVAVIGIVCGGSTFGSGYHSTRALLMGHGEESASGMQLLMRMVATWLSQWSGVPGGVFAPALAMGADLGGTIAQWTGHGGSRVLIALGMAGFLAATIQAPMTAFIIVMEMIEGHSLVLSLMLCTMIAAAVSRLLSPSMYAALTLLQLSRQSTEPVMAPTSDRAQ